MPPIRTLVVEDQPIARDRLVELLRAEPDVEVVGAADTGLDAVDAIRRLSPDLVFLDLQIPDLDGFGVISEVGHAMPLTIFVTAYDEYALAPLMCMPSTTCSNRSAASASWRR